MKHFELKISVLGGKKLRLAFLRKWIKQVWNPLFTLSLPFLLLGQLFVKIKNICQLLNIIFTLFALSFHQLLRGRVICKKDLFWSKLCPQFLAFKLKSNYFKKYLSLSLAFLSFLPSSFSTHCININFFYHNLILRRRNCFLKQKVKLRLLGQLIKLN